MIKKQNLLVIARDMYPPFRVDVTELFNAELARHITLTWVMRSGGVESFKRDSDDVSYIISGGRGRLGRTLNWAILIARQCFRLQSYSMIQCRDLILGGAFVGIASIICKKKFFYWMSFPIEQGYLHQAEQNRAQGHFFSWFVKKVIGTSGKFLLKYVTLPLASHVFVQSEIMKLDVAKSFGVPLQKLTAVPMGVSKAHFVSARSSEGLRSSAASKTVVYVGTLDSARQMDVVARAVASFISSIDEEWTFLLIGKASAAERAVVTTAFSEHASPERLVFIDQLPFTQMLVHVSQADICVATYPVYPELLRSATPTKLIEYVSMGKRIVANSHPDHDYVLSQVTLGVITEFDADKLAEGLQEARRLGEPSDEDKDFAFDWVCRNREYSLLGARVLAVYKKYSI